MDRKSALDSESGDEGFPSQYACIVDSVTLNENVLLHGPGGTGKTYTIARLVAKFATTKNVACTALTGVAAANLRAEIQAHTPQAAVDIRTLHNWSGIGNGRGRTTQDIIRRVERNAPARRRWQNTELLFIDEISMLGSQLLDTLDQVARSVRRVVSRPFGGIQLILSGDFLQLPPVKDLWCFGSPRWIALDVVPYIFEQGYRYSDADYFGLLLRARQGALNIEDTQLLRLRVKAFSRLSKSGTAGLAVVPSVLYARNVDTAAYNQAELARLQTPLQIYEAVDELSGEFSNRKRIRTQLELIVPARLALRVGAQVMLKANLNTKDGLVNGSRGVVVGVESGCVSVKFVDGKVSTLVPYTWTLEEPASEKRMASRKYARTQIPLILAWALTIHRSQASTLDCAVCDLGSSIFMAGQAYVALSRVRTLEGLYLKNFHPRSVFADSKALEFDQKLKAEEPIEYIS